MSKPRKKIKKQVYAVEFSAVCSGQIFIRAKSKAEARKIANEGRYNSRDRVEENYELDVQDIHLETEDCPWRRH